MYDSLININNSDDPTFLFNSNGTLKTDVNNNTTSNDFLQVLNFPMCSGYGQFHTNKPDSKISKPYSTITINDIINMVKSPQSIDKTQAQWFIPSTLLSRNHLDQKNNGKFYALWADIDEIGDIKFSEIAASFQNGIMPKTTAYLYTTSSATTEKQKSRIIIPISEPVDGKTFIILQTVLNDKLEAIKINPDRANQRCGQLCYLPNKGIISEKRLKIFYQSEIINGHFFNHSFMWQMEIKTYQERFKIKAKEQARAKQQQVNNMIVSGFANPVQAYNEVYSVETVLEQYGYVKHGSKWLSPNSESGQAGVIIKDNRWISNHGSDSNIGRPYNGGTSGDAFDLFAYFEHGNNKNAAIKAAGELFSINNKSINKHNQIEYNKNKEHQNNYDVPKFDYYEIPPNQKILQDSEILKNKAKQILDSHEPCKEFDLSFLPFEWKYLIEEAKKETAADSVMIVQSLMCTISAIIGKKAFIPYPDYFQDLYPNIWCCSLSNSGNFKTTALNKGSRIARIRETEITQEINELNIQKIGMKKEELEEIDNQIKALQKKSPFLSDKSTSQALFDELANGSGGMIQSSELGGWLNSINASTQSDIKEIITDFFDVPEIRTRNTIGGGKKTITKPFITINGVSTIEWVQKNLQHEDITSGFFARFLLFYPPNNKKRPNSLPHHVSSEFEIAEQMIDVTLRKFEEKTKINSIKYKLSESSKQIYDLYYQTLWDTVEQENSELKRILEPFLKRWTPYILKIAIIAQPFFNLETNEISEEALKLGKYIIDYAIKSTTYLFNNQLGESKHQMKCRKVMEWIAKNNGQCYWQQLLVSKVLAGGSSEYQYVIDTLQQSNKINFNEGKTKKDSLIKII